MYVVFRIGYCTYYSLERSYIERTITDLRHWVEPKLGNKFTVVIDILLPVTFFFNSSTRLDNVKKF